MLLAAVQGRQSPAFVFRQAIAQVPRCRGGADACCRPGLIEKGFEMTPKNHPEPHPLSLETPKVPRCPFNAKGTLFPIMQFVTRRRKRDASGCYQRTNGQKLDQARTARNPETRIAPTPRPSTEQEYKERDTLD